MCGTISHTSYEYIFRWYSWSFTQIAHLNFICKFLPIYTHTHIHMHHFFCCISISAVSPEFSTTRQKIIFTWILSFTSTNRTGIYLHWNQPTNMTRVSILKFNNSTKVILWLILPWKYDKFFEWKSKLLWKNFNKPVQLNRSIGNVKLFTSMEISRWQWISGISMDSQQQKREKKKPTKRRIKMNQTYFLNSYENLLLKWMN